MHRQCITAMHTHTCMLDAGFIILVVTYTHRNAGREDLFTFLPAAFNIV